MEENTDKEIKTTESFGDFLRRHREASGKSIENVSHVTRVGKHFLVAFEEDDHSVLPQRPFARGFLKAYAVEIGLNVDETLSRYDEFVESISRPVKDNKPLEAIKVQTVEDRRQASRRRVWSLCIGTILTAGILIFLWEARSNSSVVVDSLEESAIAVEPLVSSEIQAGSGQGVAPVTPSVLKVVAIKADVLSIKIDDNAAQAMKMKKGEARLLNIYREVELRSADKAAFKFEFDGKPLEVSGPVIKLFNRHLFKRN